MFVKLVIWTARLLLMIALSLAAGFLGSLAVRTQALDWYAALAKPYLTPPAWIFGIVWPILYGLMGIAAGLIWNIPVYLSRVRLSLFMFVSQLVLNAAWVFLFFGFRLIGWALVEIVVLWILVLATTYLFTRQSWIAGILLWPYVGWLTFAVYLNAGFFAVNR